METHKEESGGPKSATEQAQQSARVQAAAMEAHRLGAVRSEALATISLLETFCDDANGSVKANKEMMVPLGPLAFMPGRLQNEHRLKVGIGDQLFIERTPTQAVEILKRRVAYFDDKILQARGEMLGAASSRELVEELQADMRKIQKGDVKTICEPYSAGEEEEFFERRKREAAGKAPAQRSRKRSELSPEEAAEFDAFVSLMKEQEEKEKEMEEKEKSEAFMQMVEENAERISKEDKEKGTHMRAGEQEQEHHGTDEAKVPRTRVARTSVEIGGIVERHAPRNVFVSAPVGPIPPSQVVSMMNAEPEASLDDDRNATDAAAAAPVRPVSKFKASQAVARSDAPVAGKGAAPSKSISKFKASRMNKR